MSWKKMIVLVSLLILSEVTFADDSPAISVDKDSVVSIPKLKMTSETFEITTDKKTFKGFHFCYLSGFETQSSKEYHDYRKCVVTKSGDDFIVSFQWSHGDTFKCYVSCLKIGI